MHFLFGINGLWGMARPCWQRLARSAVRTFVSLIFLLVSAAPKLEGTDQPFFVDLSEVANTGLEDDGVPDNGQGGWTDEGINDMYLFPPLALGQNLYRGYPFHVLDPSQNNGKAALMLRGQKRGQNRPETVSVQVPGIKGRYLYFLQHAAGKIKGPDQYRVATYRIGYSDGTSVDFPQREGIEIRQWWVKEWWENREETRWPVHMGQNLYTQKWKFYIGLWATRWVNPHPNKPISTLRFTSGGKAAPIIFAVTASNQDYALQRKAPGNKVRRPPGVPEGYFNKKKSQESARLFEEVVRDGHAQGLRQVEIIRSDLLAITLDPALGGIGVGAWRQKAAAQGRPEAFGIESDTDVNFAPARQPLSVGRRSYEYWNGSIAGARQNILYRHTYYLFLPQPLQSGHQYKVSVEGLEARFKDEMSLSYDEAKTVTPSIKINQVAYASLSQRRYAYLGWWAGDAGPVDFGTLKEFKVIDDATGQTALRGSIDGRELSDALSGEHVYQLDLSPLGSGRYHIVVPGLGRSDGFSVGGAKIRDLYYHTMRAFYHQRCGQALVAPFSEFAKPACHLTVSKRGRIVEGEGRKNDGIRHFRGGYHDAADFDVFSIHLSSTAQVLAAYEFSPNRFVDSDLNIPESGNGIPDLLDEADWGLATYMAMQYENGAIPYGRGNDQDSIRRWRRKNGSVPPYGVFPPDFRSSMTYAAVAAHHARLLGEFDPQRAEEYLASARQAYGWAKARGVGNQLDGWYWAWAAAQLFNGTGEEGFHLDFLKIYRADLLRALGKIKPQVAFSCWGAYATSVQPGVDGMVQRAMKGLILKQADRYLAATERAPYRVGLGPKAKGYGWGKLNGGGYYADICLRAYMLSGQVQYLDTASLNADFQLGANPLSKSFITGMGSRPPNHPQISDFLYGQPEAKREPVKGITVYGLAAKKPNWYPTPPPWRIWRDLGSGGAELSSEFTITETIGATAMLYAVLYALEPHSTGAEE